MPRRYRIIDTQPTLLRAVHTYNALPSYSRRSPSLGDHVATTSAAEPPPHFHPPPPLLLPSRSLWGLARIPHAAHLPPCHPPCPALLPSPSAPQQRRPQQRPSRRHHRQPLAAPLPDLQQQAVCQRWCHHCQCPCPCQRCGRTSAARRRQRAANAPQQREDLRWTRRDRIHVWIHFWHVMWRAKY
eukprot:5310273-Pleurochrysis_carterae.AAC.3